MVVDRGTENGGQGTVNKPHTALLYTSREARVNDFTKGNREESD